MYPIGLVTMDVIGATCPRGFASLSRGGYGTRQVIAAPVAKTMALTTHCWFSICRDFPSTRRTSSLPSDQKQAPGVVCIFAMHTNVFYFLELITEEIQ
jgi:hypothetical protein